MKNQFLSRYLYFMFPFVIAPIGIFPVSVLLFQDRFTIVKCLIPFAGFLVGLAFTLRLLLQTGLFSGITLAFRQLFLLFLLIALGDWKEGLDEELRLFYCYAIGSSLYFLLVEIFVDFERINLSPVKIMIDTVTAMAIGMICMAGKLMSNSVNFHLKQSVQPLIFSLQFTCCFACIWFNHHGHNNNFHSSSVLLSCYLYNKAVLLFELGFYLMFRRLEFLFLAFSSMLLCASSIALWSKLGGSSKRPKTTPLKEK